MALLLLTLVLAVRLPKLAAGLITVVTVELLAATMVVMRMVVVTSSTKAAWSHPNA